MADEIQFARSITYANGSLKDSVPNATEKITQAAQSFHASVTNVGLAEEDLTVGDITAANGCWAFLTNLDATNFVKYGPKSGGSMIEFGRLYPLKSAWFFLAPSVVLRMIADTAACRIVARLYEK